MNVTVLGTLLIISGQEDSSRVADFIYNYQQLLGTLVALIVGVATVIFLWKQIDQQRKLKVETALALCRMFHEELKIFARFFLRADKTFVEMLSNKRLSGIAAIRYPDHVAFSTQATRLSEIRPQTALALMYFYQALLFLEQVTAGRFQAEGKDRVLVVRSAYSRTIENLVDALERTSQDLTRQGVAAAENDKALLQSIEGLVSRE